MGIDRTEDGDGPTRLPDRPAEVDAEVDAPSPLDAGERAAEHARYRAQVEEYEAAGDARERHAEQYLERERPIPRTKPDGSWVGSGDRELSPEQNAEATKACADICEEGKEVILPAMRRIETADPNRHLDGLENMLKGEDRLKEKIADALRARPELTVAQALSIVPDPVRFTLSYSMERYADGVRADVERIKAEGFELIKLKNVWSGDQYKGINSQWRRPESGLRFEVQFHTPESLEAKELTHKAYERIRSGQASPAEIHELEEFQRGVNALIVTPPDTAAIKDFPEKNND